MKLSPNRKKKTGNWYINEYLFCNRNGSPWWSIPQQECRVLGSGCSPPLSAGHGMCCDCHGYPQRWLQWGPGGVLHGGVVLLLRRDGGGVFPGCHSSPQLPASVLGQPDGHMCGLRHAHVSSYAGSVAVWSPWQNFRLYPFCSFLNLTVYIHITDEIVCPWYFFLL